MVRFSLPRVLFIEQPATGCKLRILILTIGYSGFRNGKGAPFQAVVLSLEYGKGAEGTVRCWFSPDLASPTHSSAVHGVVTLASLPKSLGWEPANSIP